MHKNFIVIEGLDGSGKSTQLKLLRKHLKENKKAFKDIHFPMLDNGNYGQLIAEFLRGDFGALNEVHPKIVALLFAEDRNEHKLSLEKWLAEDMILIADRYVLSNIAYQCAKLNSEEEKQSLQNWILDFEYGHNKLPQAYKTIYLDVPFKAVKSNLENVREGEDRAYLKGEKDIHESDLSFQEKVRNEYLRLCKELPNFNTINCADENGDFLKAESIHQIILEQFEL